MKLLGHLLLVLTPFLTACASKRPNSTPSDQHGQIPAAFMAAYPSGSQARELRSVHSIFSKRQQDFYEKRIAPLQFGPAAGEGLFIFSYPLTFDQAP